MSVRDPKTWMPDKMLDSDKDYFLKQHPDDPHMAAAVAWDAWASTLEAEAVVASVHTGAQSISYAKGYTPALAAMERASWHRARSKVVSVIAGPHYEYTGFALDLNPIPTEHMNPWWEK